MSVVGDKPKKSAYNSETLNKYKMLMTECLELYTDMDRQTISDTIDYSINKRLKDTKDVLLENNYEKKTYRNTLLSWADWIDSKEPIVTAHGTLFKKHGEVPNPLGQVIQLFLDQRIIDKNLMLSFPKGSEDYEKYNLFQQLDKIDANGIYGILGMFTCLIFNINVASSVTAQGRALISTVTLFFESFLANNVKFGSLDEALVFIDNVCKEERTYDDNKMLTHHASVEECFAKVVLSCGYHWIPTEEEREVIWQVICRLGQQDLDRVYYKNNLYEFLDNDAPKRAIKYIMKKMKNPFFNSLKPPKEIIPELEEFASILKEYVYYDKMWMDRIDRCASMIKSTIMISDTDSCIVSLDAWYRFVLDLIKDEEIGITKYDPIDILTFVEKDEFGEIEDMESLSPLVFKERKEFYDFENDEIIEEEHLFEPFVIQPQDYLRYSIINIMGYVIDVLVNDHLLQFTKCNHSYAEGKDCKIILKNEFTFTRILMSLVKKAYASEMGIQEGHVIPEGQKLAITGMDKLAKSSTPKSTRDGFKKILLEDIIKADTIDQYHIIEDLAIMERRIIENIQDGKTDFYKPVTIKAQSSYEDPMRIQGITASTIWNAMKDDDYPGIDLDERNAILVAKTSINPKSVEMMKEEFPEKYEILKDLMNNKKFKGGISSIAIPRDIEPPAWFRKMVDYKTIVNDNIGGFMYDSVGIVNMSDNTNYSNILQL